LSFVVRTTPGVALVALGLFMSRFDGGAPRHPSDTPAPGRRLASAPRERTGLLVVAHGAEPAWNARVQETVAQVRWARGPVALAFLMGQDMSADWDAAVDTLVAGGVQRIVVVPLLVSSHSGHYRQIAYCAGALDTLQGTDAPAPCHRRSPVPMRMTPALDAAPHLGAALAGAWSALGPADRARPVVLVAHGPNPDSEAQLWLANLGKTTAPAFRAAGQTAELRVGLLRDDAPPPVRAAAVAALRDTIQRLAAAARDSVVVLPVLISSGAIDQVRMPRDLAGLPIRFVPVSLAPRPELARWIEDSAGGEEAQRGTDPATRQPE